MNFPAITPRALRLPMLALLLAVPLCGHPDSHPRIVELSRMIDERPQAELLLERGELHRVRQEFVAALSDYEAAERLAPRMDAVWLARGRALLESDLAGPARQAFDEFLLRKPEHANGHLLRARAWLAEGEPTRAVADFDRSIFLAAEPRPDVFAERAAVLDALGDHERALAGLDEGIRRLGPIPSLHLPALATELKLGRFDAALRRVDGLMAEAGRKESWLARRAEILAQAGRAAAAAEAWGATLAAITALPERFRTLPATEELAARARAALVQLSEHSSVSENPVSPLQHPPS
jgi:tetratricopeptide (TPR) repeat protein